MCANCASILEKTQLIQIISTAVGMALKFDYTIISTKNTDTEY